MIAAYLAATNVCSPTLSSRTFSTQAQGISRRTSRNCSRIGLCSHGFCRLRMLLRLNIVVPMAISLRSTTDTHSDFVVWELETTRKSSVAYAIFSLSLQSFADDRVVLMKGRNDEAFQVIQKLHAQPDDPDDTFARKEFYQMTQQFALDEQKKQNLGVVHWWDYFKKASYRRRILIGCGATLSSACSGNLVVNSKSIIKCPCICSMLSNWRQKNRLPSHSLYRAWHYWRNSNPTICNLEHRRHARQYCGCDRPHGPLRPQDLSFDRYRRHSHMSGI